MHLKIQFLHKILPRVINFEEKKTKVLKTEYLCNFIKYNNVLSIQRKLNPKNNS